MKKNNALNKPRKSTLNIPASKLPNTLAQTVSSSLWKKIIYSIENREVEPILQIIHYIDRQVGSPCLPHPFAENLDTFPVKSVREGMCNFIFFSDSENKNMWVLCQCTSFVDAIFSTEFSGKHILSASDDGILGSFRRILKKDEKILKQRQSRKAVFAGYLLDQKRPYHHFYDQLKWMVHLDTKKPIISKYSFFIPKSMYTKADLKRNNRASFKMFPTVIGSSQLGMKLDQYSEKMEKLICKDSLKDSYLSTVNYNWNKFKNKIKAISGKGKTFTLWFGISGQKRIWIEQEDFLPTLAEEMKPWFESFVFLIDGFTQYEDAKHRLIKGSKEIPVSQDLEVVDSICQKLLPFTNVTVVSLIGQTYREKIQNCRAVDFFIANAGAGQLVPHRFCKKPGILHSNEKHCVFPKGINNTTVKLVDKSLVKDVGNLFAKGKRAERSGSGLISYSINSNTIIDMIKEMKNLAE